MKVITTYVEPPIPINIYDWQAQFVGQESPEDMVGHGATEAEAIENLYEEFIMSNQEIFNIVEKLAKLSEGLDMGNSAAEFAAANLAAQAKKLIESTTTKEPA